MINHQRHIQTEESPITNRLYLQIQLSDRNPNWRKHLPSIKLIKPKINSSTYTPKTNNNIVALSDLVQEWNSKSNQSLPQAQDTHTQSYLTRPMFQTSAHRITTTHKIKDRPSRFISHQYTYVDADKSKLKYKKLTNLSSTPSKNIKVNKPNIRIKQPQAAIRRITGHSKQVVATNPFDYFFNNQISQTGIVQEQERTKLNPTPFVNRTELMTPCQRIDEFNQQHYGNKVVRQLLNQEAPSFTSLSNKKEKFTQIRRSLLQILIYLNKLHISSKEFFDNQIFPKKPFDRVNSRVYLQLCKMGKYDQVALMLEHDKYLVYQYDYLMMTALHWCAQRGLIQMAGLLLRNGADFDAQDIVGRTPLYLALANKKNEMAQLLLLHKADPWNKINCDYSSTYIDNPDAQQVLSSSRKLHILLKMTPPNMRNSIWQKEQLALFIDPTISECDL